MTIVYHNAFDQGSEAWLQARCGMLTASEVKHILTPTLKIAANDDTRKHLYELLQQRIKGYAEPGFQGWDMLRGQEDEIKARAEYEKRFSPVKTCAFITNDDFGFDVGFSPDGLVQDDGFIEVKSRTGWLQVRSIIEHVRDQTCPPENVLQVQAGLMISGRNWCDLISYSAGLPMWVIRVLPDPKVQGAIRIAAEQFEERLRAAHQAYREAMSAGHRTVPTERPEPVELEMAA